MRRRGYANGSWVSGFEGFVRAVAIALFVGLGGIIAGAICVFTLFDMQSAPLLKTARDAVSPQARYAQNTDTLADANANDDGVAPVTQARTVARPVVAPVKRLSGGMLAPSTATRSVAIGTVRQEPLPGGTPSVANQPPTDDAAGRGQTQSLAVLQPASDETAAEDQPAKQDTVAETKKSRKARVVRRSWRERDAWNSRRRFGFFGGGGGAW
jgi:hypothetical protein